MRWAVVLVPPLIVAVLALLTDTVLDEVLPVPWSAVTVALAVLIIGVVVAAATFGRIDALSMTLQAQNRELEARSASANALNRVSVATASLSDVDDVLDAVVVYARELLGADVAVLLLEGADGRLELRAAAGPPGAILAPAGLAATRPSRGALGEPTATQRPASRPTPSSRSWTRLAPPSGCRLPCSAAARPSDCWRSAVRRSRGFDADQVETLASLANQATIALEHARLEDRLRELAVVEERERIARELHDGIAQVLGYVNTKSQAIDGSWRTAAWTRRASRSPSSAPPRAPCTWTCARRSWASAARSSPGRAWAPRCRPTRNGWPPTRRSSWTWTISR